MARYTATVQTSKPIEEAFAYLSDFATTEQWDPSVVEAERLDERPVEKGTRFRVRSSFLGNESDLVYEITDIEPPRRVVLRGENAGVVSVDEMTFETIPGGTSVGYNADLQFKGVLRLAGPLFTLVFRRIGDRAKAGLRARLS